MSVFDGFDVAGLEGGLGTLIASEVAPLFGAAAEDLKDFGLGCAKHGMLAMVTADKAWTAEVKAQLVGLLEIQRIRVEVVDWDLTEKIVALIFKGATAAIGAAIPRP